MDPKTDSSTHPDSPSGRLTLYWWATLVVAVLAVPSFGIVVTLMTGTTGLLQIWIFMLACWFCTYLGMRLMRHPRMTRPFDLHNSP
jgi:hypothetical protein